MPGQILLPAHGPTGESYTSRTTVIVIVDADSRAIRYAHLNHWRTEGHKFSRKSGRRGGCYKVRCRKETIRIKKYCKRNTEVITSRVVSSEVLFVQIPIGNDEKSISLDFHINDEESEENSLEMIG
ncbi:hypothetical protein ALC62_10144 [Cyphomyrmex costatus]|uniref:Uncharacterized protein n=1 Tax=Cyphomyrmex costatus TaxID=456900 RepID=A0A195CEP8_9HYME|nr:hypothetical protein ALC62_10144 [Cyphomyrmex costatus]